MHVSRIFLHVQWVVLHPVLQLQVTRSRTSFEAGSCPDSLLLALTFVGLGSKLYDSLNVDEFLAYAFQIRDSLFVLLSM